MERMKGDETPPRIDLEQLQRRCIALFGEPAVRGKGWMPRLFWHPVDAGNPFGVPRMDPLEMEVLFTAILGRESMAYDTLERLRPGRAAFIARSIRHGELPLLNLHTEAGSA